jgi:hypothetical protein
MRQFRRTKVKKLFGDRPTKFVRVDPRTVLEVDADISNDLVIQRFNERQLKNIEAIQQFPNMKHKGVDFFR